MIINIWDTCTTSSNYDSIGRIAIPIQVKGEWGCEASTQTISLKKGLWISERESPRSFDGGNLIRPLYPTRSHDTLSYCHTDKYSRKRQSAAIILGSTLLITPCSGSRASSDIPSSLPFLRHRRCSFSTINHPDVISSILRNQATQQQNTQNGNHSHLLSLRFLVIILSGSAG